MENLKQYKYIILIALIILGVSFYWFQYRPSQIRKGCSIQVEKMRKSGKDSVGRHSVQISVGDREAINGAYNDCIRKSGL